MILEVNSLTKNFGDRCLFADASFKIEPNDKIGLIGANGSGKTTLFKIICSEMVCDAGGVVKSGGTSIGVLKQHACEGSQRSAYDEVLTVFQNLLDMEFELSTVANQLTEEHSEKLILRQHELIEKFERMGGLTFKSRALSALRGLGFNETEMALSVSMLSGGQKSKIELCKLLLSEPDLMLLDEPTNHLDIEAIEWLDEYIRTYKGAVLIISHDRFFLDKTVGKIFEITNKRVDCYGGNYSAFLTQRQLRQQTAIREYENTMKEVKRIEGIIAQQRQWNKERNIKTAEHKQKSIDRLLDGLEKPDSENDNMKMTFKTDRESGNDVLLTQNLTKKYGEKTLYNDISLDVKKGQKIFIIGPNGCGKTTLLKDIMYPVGDKVRLGASVKMGYFDQHGLNLDQSKTVFGFLRDYYENLTDTEIRNCLAAFLFKGDDVFKMIADLSGGEKARVALSKLMLEMNNLLLLDEPTNHLDIASREVLENALCDYDGTLIAVSHDRYFINKLATKIIYFENGEVKQLDGNYDDYFAVKQEATPQKVQKSGPGEGGRAYQERKKSEKELKKIKTAIKKEEEKMASLEQKASELQEQLNSEETQSDYEEVMRLTELLSQNEQEMLLVMEEWEKLSTLLAEKEED